MSTPAHPVLVARALLLAAALVSGPVLVTQAQESIETAESAPVDTREIQALRDALAGIESNQGAYAQALPERLISLGLALQQQGRQPPMGAQRSVAVGHEE